MPRRFLAADVCSRTRLMALSSTSSASKLAVARPAGVLALPALEAPLLCSCFQTQTLFYARAGGIDSVCAGKAEGSAA